MFLTASKIRPMRSLLCFLFPGSCTTKSNDCNRLIRHSYHASTSFIRPNTDKEVAINKTKPVWEGHGVRKWDGSHTGSPGGVVKRSQALPQTHACSCICRRDGDLWLKGSSPEERLEIQPAICYSVCLAFLILSKDTFATVADALALLDVAE